MGRPVKKYKLGFIEGAVFENEYDGQKSYSIKFQKSYKGKDGNFKNTDFFTEADLRNLSCLVNGIVSKQIKEYNDGPGNGNSAPTPPQNRPPQPQGESFQW